MEKYVRKATENDLSKTMTIIEKAKKMLSDRGIPQWQKGFGPDETLLAKDIEENQLFVLCADGAVVGVAAMTQELDPAYDAMTTPWQEIGGAYISIHRFALTPAVQGKGLAKWFLKELILIGHLAGFKDIRIDTHPDNYGMQSVIQSVGFEKMGTINLAIPDGERYAYQYINRKERQDEKQTK